ncbi:hypothetical protein HK102_002308 [Quaeritorhiza haematococci]|nr:hypothetical protein HK102_002308 [Quaeritorhiza haematococci]
MWRRNGDGEVYLYANDKIQDRDWCDRPIIHCSPTYGTSVGRGSWRFSRGAWTKVRQIIRLNSFATSSDGSYRDDGSITVFVNDSPTPILFVDKVVLRDKRAVVPLGIDFETFFGGSDDSWASPLTQYSYYKGFKIAGY